MGLVNIRAGWVGALVAACPLLVANASVRVLYSFAGGTDGAAPAGALVAGANGALYGITVNGGNQGCTSSLSQGCGTVFALTPAAGGWSERVLHAFDQATEGGQPLAGPVQDAAGNLYGSTEYYGPHGIGGVWQLVPAADGSWNANLLHAFDATAGGFDCTGLAFDGATLLGVTFAGGTTNSGTFFQLAADGAGRWAERVLHDFAGGSSDGNAPSAPPTLVTGGHAFGTTYEGGPHLTGTVYELTRTRTGWSEEPIYVFQGLPFAAGADGTNPTAGIIVGRDGHLFGTTDYGGAAGVGTVFELSPDGAGGWTEQVLYSFTDRADGGHPGGLVQDAAGNLYGVTSGHRTAGSVYRLTRTAAGAWEFVLLHAFTGAADGGAPTGTLLLDPSGNLYGVATHGGAHGQGVVFEVSRD